MPWQGKIYGLSAHLTMRFKYYIILDMKAHISEKPDVVIDLLKSIDLKLGLILGRMIRKNDSEIVVKDEIKEFYKLGADSKTIAQILGISTDHASQEISRYKRSLKLEKNDGQKKRKDTREE